MSARACNNTPADQTRRRLCVGAAAWVATLAAHGAARAQVSADHGKVVPPVPVPNLSVFGADGAATGLATLLEGRATALHLMFTGCSTVCPIQGAIFQRVQALLPDQRERGIQLLSLSIDPSGDTPASLRAWLERFDAQPGWTAAIPKAADLDRVRELFGQGPQAAEYHATQVSIINRNAELIFKSPELPAADSIAELLRRV